MSALILAAECTLHLLFAEYYGAFGVYFMAKDQSSKVPDVDETNDQLRAL